MRAILDKIFELKKDLDADWTEELDRFNILPDIAPIYDSEWPIKKKNILFAYLVLAYHNNSEWMEVHKDRRQIKFKIFKRLGADITDEFYKTIVEGNNPAMQKVAIWFTLWQRDYRWADIRACFDYHAEMMAFAGTKTPDKFSKIEFEEDEQGVKNEVTTTEEIDFDKQIQNNIKKNQCITAGREQREHGMKMLLEIQREFVNLDTALHKEGGVRITETVDIMKWESFIEQLRTKKDD